MRTSRSAIILLAGLALTGAADAGPRASFLPAAKERSAIVSPVQYRDYYDDGYDDYDRRDRRYDRRRDRDDRDGYERRDRDRRDDRGGRNRGDRREQRPQRRGNANDLSQYGDVITNPNDPRLRRACQILPNEPACRRARGR